MKLSEAIEQLCIATRVDGRRPRTVQSYQNKLGHLLEYLGDVEVEDITLADLRGFSAAQMDQGVRYKDHHIRGPEKGSLSPFTVASRIRHMKRLFNWLEEEGILDKNPARRIKTPKPKRDKPKGISIEDFRALLRTASGDSLYDLRDRAIMMFLFDTACRVGGLCGLKVDDIDLAARRAIITEKGKKTRVAFYTQDTAKALAAWLRVRPDDNDWVFVGLSHAAFGNRLSTRGVAHILRRRAKQADCKGPTNPHAFRHGFAREFLKAGGDLATLSRIMGHSDVAVTANFYSIFTMDELQGRHDEFSPLRGE